MSRTSRIKPLIVAQVPSRGSDPSDKGQLVPLAREPPARNNASWGLAADFPVSGTGTTARGSRFQNRAQRGLTHPLSP